MNIKKMKIDDLKAAKYNPRVDLRPGDEEFQHIKNSIENFGYIEPIIVNSRNNVIVGGHQRTKVLRELGYEEIDVILVDLDEEQEKAANIALNSATGLWDFEKLNALIDEIKDYDMSMFGLEKELEKVEEELKIENTYEEDEESESTNSHFLKIDRYEIPLSDEEYEEISSNIKKYLEINGVLFGFYKYLKE